jgi:hypothetical protein
MNKIFVTLMILAASGSAFALDCPAQFGNSDYLSKVSAAIKGSDNCESGSAIAEACALGASGDLETVPVAEQKCRLDFWKKLSKTDMQGYKNLQSKCDSKYKNQQGTMYLSANAFCYLQVARLYSELYTPANY